MQGNYSKKVLQNLTVNGISDLLIENEIFNTSSKALVAVLLVGQYVRPKSERDGFRDLETSHIRILKKLE